jgi:hypothetical protein
LLSNTPLHVNVSHCFTLRNWLSSRLLESLCCFLSNVSRPRNLVRGPHQELVRHPKGGQDARRTLRACQRKNPDLGHCRWRAIRCASRLMQSNRLGSDPGWGISRPIAKVVAGTRERARTRLLRLDAAVRGAFAPARPLGHPGAGQGARDHASMRLGACTQRSRPCRDSSGNAVRWVQQG